MSAHRANLLSGSDWLKNSFSIWRGFAKNRDAIGHPAPFPVELISRLIDCYVANPDNGVFLDPMAGSGSGLLAGLRAGMSVIGFDINPDYRNIFEQRLSLSEANSKKWKYEVRDARTTEKILEPDSIEICVTSPPYWDILNRRRSADGKQANPYSTNGEDLGNLTSYNKFLVALESIAKQVGIVLRPQGYFIINIMDIRKGPDFYPLHQDASKAVMRTGSFTYEDIIVWDRQADYNSMRPLGYPYKFIINKVHEYLLVFRKEKTRGVRYAKKT